MNGLIEYWSNGMMGNRARRGPAVPASNRAPSLHHSIRPFSTDFAGWTVFNRGSRRDKERQRI